MFMKRILTILMLLLTIFLAGCGAGRPRDSAIIGLIDHPHNMTLPLGTVMTIQIVDSTKAGSPGKVIAEQVIKDQEIGIPTQFMVIYNRGKINEDHSYSILVNIEDSTGKLLYKNEKELHVITQGYPTQGIDVYVVLVDG
jgi:uncharacterized lipoprotein YbaY